jgi:hypothetical protein
LRENEDRRPEPPEPGGAGDHDRRVIAELESWLAAIMSDRPGQTSA